MVSKKDMSSGIKENISWGQGSCYIAQVSLKFLGLKLMILCLNPLSS